MGPLLTRLDSWLAKHRARFHKNLQPGAAVGDLHALSNSIAKYLPAALSELLSWHNGQGDDYVGYFVDHWLLMSAAKIAAAKNDLDSTGGEYGWKTDWVPFLDDDSGDFVVLDLSQEGPPVLAYWMGEHTTPLAPSLEVWLGDFVTGVEAGQYHEDPERGTFRGGDCRKRALAAACWLPSGCLPENAGGSLRHLDHHERPRGIEVILTRFIDDAHKIPCGRLFVRQRAVDLASFKRCRVTVVVHAHCIGRELSLFRHRQSSISHLIFLHLSPVGGGRSYSRDTLSAANNTYPPSRAQHKKVPFFAHRFRVADKNMAAASKFDQES